MFFVLFHENYSMHFHFDKGFPLICVYFSVSRQCFYFLSIFFFFFLLLLSLFANNFTSFLYTSVILISPQTISLSYCVLHSFSLFVSNFLICVLFTFTFLFCTPQFFSFCQQLSRSFLCVFHFFYFCQ